MKVRIAGVWIRPTDYESHLIPALKHRGLAVERCIASFRPLPYTSASAAKDAIVHVQWPEAALDKRFPKLTLAASAFDLRWVDTSRWVVTAHNLFPHEFATSEVGEWYSRFYRAAHAVVAHSEAARDVVVERHGVERSRCFVVPHGDLASGWDLSNRRSEARRRLRWDARPTALVFGRIRSYKGVEAIVARWRKLPDDFRLAVVGRADGAIRQRLRSVAGDDARIELRFGTIAENVLGDLLAAADATVFNYSAVLTSGAADLARSCGVPVLLPQRHGTVDLDEPSPRVFRFDTLDGNFADQLRKALSVGADWASAEPWRAAHRWDRIAEELHRVYERVAAEKR